jgi:hypothetical protein
MGPEDRGRSPQRLSKKAKAPSPRGKLSSPLARVAEEAVTPIRVHTELDSRSNGPIDNLISVETPRPSDDFTLNRGSLSSDKENKEDKSKAPAVKSPVPEESELKTVEI